VGFGELRSDKPINITADRMDAFQKENRVIFEGNVVVQQEETFLYAKKIIADMAPQKEGGGIKKVVALENVRITQNDRVATCDRAEFDNVTRTIELHGNPKIWQGKDWIDGQKVTVQLDQEKMTVVGTPDKRVSAVLHPKPQRKEDESGQKAEASSAERRKMIASFAPTEAESKASKGQAKADKPKGKTHEDKGPEPQGHEKGEPPSTPSPETPRPQALAISTKAVAAEEEAARIAAKAPRGQESSSSQVKGGEAKKETKAQEPEPLERFLEKWRRAWESKDIESYMSFYSKKFKSGSMDWNGWRNYKANTFKKTGTIKVVIESVQSRKVGEKVQVSFVQRYSADKHSDYGIKELVIVKEEGQWRIVAEGWRPIKEKSS
jgi:lipopolysaccharide export system protein LptA